ncbi:MAG: peptidoglycan recognition family protein [Bacteroidota bacterium]
MNKWWIMLLVLALVLLLSISGLGVPVRDIRQKLPKHPTKRFGRRKKSKITGIVLHHSAGGIHDTPWDIADYHVGPNHISDTGTPGVNYTVIIDRKAKIYWCNDLEAITWHVSGQNTENASICVIGDYEMDEPTKAQLRAVKSAKRWLEWRVGKRLPMQGHDQACGGCKDCPGKNLKTAMGYA